MSPSRQYSSHPDPMDLWLETQGYHRKLTARDASCLFRAISEQVYNSQKYHLEVRKLCVEFMKNHLDVFDGHQVEGGIENYLEHLLSPNQRGGICEIKAISNLYKVDVLIFKEVGKPAEKVLETAFTKQIMLCSSRDGHYDSVYSTRYTKIAGFLQSLLYGILYKNVFSMKDADFAVEKMLHHKPMRHRGETGSSGHRKFSSYSCNSIQLQKKGGVLETVFEDEDVNIRELIMKGITPFPYKVAKSLDPNIFRNVEFDVWIDHRRGLKQGYFGLNSELGVGVKCLVQINNETSIAHIQEMSPNKGPVVVFVEELGEKRTVPFENLELLPQENVNKQIPSNHLNYRLTPQLTDNKSSLLTPLEGCLGGKVSKTGSDFDSKTKSNMRGSYENTDNSTMVAKFSMENYNIHGEYHHPYQCKPNIEMNMNLPIQTHILMSPQQHGNSPILIPVSPRPEDVPAHWLPTNGVAVQGSSEIDVSTSANLDPPSSQIQDTLKAVPSLDMMDNNGNYLPNENFQGQQINFNAPKSFQEDGTDLPMSDVQTLRFFYNLGNDVYHSQYGMYSWGGYTQACTSTSPSTPNPPGICSGKCLCGPVCISTVPTIHHLLEPSTPPSSAKQGLDDSPPVLAIQQAETKSSQSTPQTSPSTPLASVPSRFKTKGKNKKDAKAYEGQPLIQPSLQIPPTDDSTNIESQNDGPAAGSSGGHSSPTLSVPYSQSYGYVYYPTSPVVPYSPVESEPYFTPLRLQFPTEYIPDTPQSPQCYSVNGELNIYNSSSQYSMIATSPHYLLPASPGIYVGSPPAWSALTPTTPQ